MSMGECVRGVFMKEKSWIKIRVSGPGILYVHSIDLILSNAGKKQLAELKKIKTNRGTR